MKKLHELSELEIEEWKKARAKAGEEEYGDDHLARYNLVDIMEELLDAEIISDLFEERYEEEQINHKILSNIIALRSNIYQAIKNCQEIDKYIDDEKRNDSKGGDRI